MKTILYELNEVPRRLFDFYADDAPDSSFARLRKHGRLFETVAQDVGHLSPWITWPSLHRGVPNVYHKISDLGQDLTHVNKDYPPIWTLLAQNGQSVGMFGSLQSYPMPEDLDNYKFYVPDTFAASPECFPDELTEFQRFNLSMVRANGRNVSRNIALREAFDFMKAAPGLGLRGKTVAKIASQVIGERLNPNRVVRRRTSQVQIAFDFFLKSLRRTQPDVSFFFTNHVASSMHRYWPSIFPEDYEAGKFDAQWMSDWKGEIPAAVHEANGQLAQLIRFVDANPGFRLLVLSSMGQAAVRDVEPVHRQVLISDVEKLMSFLGISKEDWEPRLSMAPLVVVRLKNDSGFEKLEKLKSISLNGTHIEATVLETGDVRFSIMLANVDDLKITGPDGAGINPDDMGVSNVDLQDASGSYAYHVPEGILIDYRSKAHNAAGQNAWHKVSALDVAPSILEEFNISRPSHMEGETGLFS